MDKEQVLLKEYEVCQQHNDSIGSQAWVSTTIFLTINVTLLGGLYYTLISKIAFINSELGEINLALLILILLAGVTALGVGIIWILRKWIDWLKRMRFRTSINFERMVGLENTLGMRRHTMCHELDEEKESLEKSDTDARKAFEAKTKRFKYFRASGFDGLICIAKILMGVWSFSLSVLWAIAIISFI